QTLVTNGCSWPWMKIQNSFPLSTSESAIRKIPEHSCGTCTVVLAAERRSQLTGCITTRQVFLMRSVWIVTSLNWSNCLANGDSMTQMRGTPQVQSWRCYPKSELAILILTTSAHRMLNGRISRCGWRFADLRV